MMQGRARTGNHNAGPRARTSTNCQSSTRYGGDGSGGSKEGHGDCILEFLEQMGSLKIAGVYIASLFFLTITIPHAAMHSRLEGLFFGACIS